LPPRSAGAAGPTGTNPALASTLWDAALSWEVAARTMRTPCRSAAIRLELNKTPDNELGAEGYHLAVTTKNIVIRANQPAGLFYGIQTLLQLLPKEIESHEKVTSVNWQAPCITITDYPRFGWRGLMFDVSRHFFTKAEVKSFIDEMVKYKYNLLHFHLTDDEGWRIQIKSLPRLTEVGAWSVHRVGTFGTFSAPGPEEPSDIVVQRRDGSVETTRVEGANAFVGMIQQFADVVDELEHPVFGPTESIRLAAILDALHAASR